MKNKRKTNTDRLGAYLTAAVGIGTLAGTANAATVVTLYGPGAQNPSTSPATPLGINIGKSIPPLNIFDADLSGSISSIFAKSGSAYFTQGSDLVASLAGLKGTYYSFKGGFQGGAQAGPLNYANISFNGNDGVYEAVAQFFFTGTGAGYLMALARSDDYSALSISAGKAAIDGASAIPEPASVMSTMGLLASGLLIRRRKQAA